MILSNNLNDFNDPFPNRTLFPCQISVRGARINKVNPEF